jgi:TrmH family RNA methyltransferase
MITKTHTKYIQSLHQKKFRDENGVFIAETPKVVEGLLKAKYFVCKQVLALHEWIKENAIMLNKYDVQQVVGIKEFELDRISALNNANAVLAIFEKRESNASFSPKKKITLALDNIQDPGNLGTIIRTADWFGIENIVCNEATVEKYNPKVVQSTMGSLASVNIVYTDLHEWLQKNKALKIYAAALQGRPAMELKGTKEGIIVIGNEANGISKEIMTLCAEKITIPKVGKAESLNAAVAAGIILSHIS